MDGFSGYISTFTKKDGGQLIETFSFLLKNYTQDEMWKAPMNPLAVVGQTLERVDQPHLLAFYRGEYLLNVIDATRGRLETYDVDRVETELEMEILAG